MPVREGVRSDLFRAAMTSDDMSVQHFFNQVLGRLEIDIPDVAGADSGPTSLLGPGISDQRNQMARFAERARMLGIARVARQPRLEMNRSAAFSERKAHRDAPYHPFCYRRAAKGEFTLHRVNGIALT